VLLNVVLCICICFGAHTSEFTLDYSNILKVKYVQNTFCCNNQLTFAFCKNKQTQIKLNKILQAQSLFFTLKNTKKNT